LEEKKMPLQKLSDKDFVRALHNRYDDGTLQFGWRTDGLEFAQVFATIYSEDLTQALRITLSPHYLSFQWEEVQWGVPSKTYHNRDRTLYSNASRSLWEKVYPEVMAGYNGMIAERVGLLQLAH
jgi:hypothetical protein